MKHTPGPWKVYKNYLRKEISGIKIIEVQDINGKAVVPWNGFDAANQSKKEKEANARLIAAAPELLAACKEARRSLFIAVKSNSHGLLSDDEVNKHIVIKKLDAAISKAEG